MTPDLQDHKTDAPTDARQIRSRKALHAVLLSLLSERPFDQLTVREITKRAGTGYATFFRHFQTREALLADIALGQISDLLRMIVPTLSPDESRESIQRLCGFIEESETSWRALLTGGAADIVRAQVLREARGCDDNAFNIAPEIPAELGIAHGVGATIDVIAWWLRSGEDAIACRDAEQVASILQRMVVAPIIGDSTTRAA